MYLAMLKSSCGLLIIYEYATAWLFSMLMSAYAVDSIKAGLSLSINGTKKYRALLRGKLNSQIFIGIIR